ncbi:hypothetical protein P154DRAFT_174555 [Amniculicola lignicola CBS 123094]|uniref:Uncharacterized protein n=1 Tax=Amniculicola lignicola CBS 123094 TaxID=1392246 RepID=A0A6A5WM27_9PLEO|nr:hypothetical protein P154DRAFT_174555 [Amniculicola lignicola CBS 123094]
MILLFTINQLFFIPRHGQFPHNAILPLTLTFKSDIIWVHVSVLSIFSYPDISHGELYVKANGFRRTTVSNISEKGEKLKFSTVSLC